MKRICSTKKPFMLRSLTPEAAASLDWSKLESELELSVPSLFSILKSATCENTSNKSKEDQSSSEAESKYWPMCCNSPLPHNHSMNLVQRILSVLLYNGHASKPVRQLI